MTWFKIDDAFWAHPKTMALSPDAIALWVRAGSWSCQTLTDGIIPDRALPLFAPAAGAPAELVDAGFWYEIGGAHEFHDWAEYQESSGMVKDRRRKNADKMRKWRDAKAEKAHQKDSNQVSDPVTNEVTNPVRNQVRNPLPDPTRPDLLTSNEVSKNTPAKAGRGSRLPEPFIVTSKMREWASEEVATINVDEATRSFVDYWRGRAGAGGVKVDWVATWRNSLRSAAKREQGVKRSKVDQIVDVLEQGKRMQEEHDRKAIGQ